MTKYIAAALRNQIVRLWLTGASAMTISNHLRVSLSTVYRWVRRWQEQGTVKTKPYRKRCNISQCVRLKVKGCSLIKRTFFEHSLPNFNGPLGTLSGVSHKHISPLFISHYHIWLYSTFLHRLSLFPLMLCCNNLNQ